MPFWHRIVIVAAVALVSAVVAKLIDLRIARHQLGPEVATRYRVLRRCVMTGIVFIGVLSALLVIPQVRAVAGGLLASSAVLTVIIGFAAQRTLGNFAAGLMIAFTQPVRLGDRVTVAGADGIVEEIALTYTIIRADDNTRLVIPNEKLASDTIRNSTIVSRESLAMITVQVPLDTDLRGALDVIRKQRIGEREPEVFVSSLEGNATITVRVWAPNEAAADRIEADLRVQVHEALRGQGVWAAA